MMFRKKKTTKTNEKIAEKPVENVQETKSLDASESEIIIQRKPEKPRYNPINKGKKYNPRPKSLSKSDSNRAPLSKKLTPDHKNAIRHHSPIKKRNTDTQLDIQVGKLESAIRNLADDYHKLIEENEWLMESYLGKRTHDRLEKNLQTMSGSLANVSKMLKEKAVVSIKRSLKEIEDTLIFAQAQYKDLETLTIPSSPEEEKEIQKLCKFRLETIITQCGSLLLDYNALDQSIAQYSGLPQHAWVKEHLKGMEEKGLGPMAFHQDNLEKLRFELKKIFSNADSMTTDELKTQVRDARDELDRAEKNYKSNFKPVSKLFDRVKSKEEEKVQEEDIHWKGWGPESDEESEDESEHVNDNQPKPMLRTKSAASKQNTLFGGDQAQQRGNADVPDNPVAEHHKTWPRPKK